MADLQRFLPGKPKRTAGCDIEKPPACSHIKELIPKFDEDTSLAVNGDTDVNSAADVSRVFDSAVGYPAATAAGESVYPGQSEDELKAFMYNMYYDPVLIFIYEVWGRYGQPSPI